MRRMFRTLGDFFAARHLRWVLAAYCLAGVAAPFNPDQAASIVGTWIADDGGRVEFSKDGRVTLVDAEPGRLRSLTGHFSVVDSHQINIVEESTSMWTRSFGSALGTPIDPKPVGYAYLISGTTLTLTELKSTSPKVYHTRQVLVIDDLHLQLKDPGRLPPIVPPTKYSIKPGPALVLDASKYEFRIPLQMANKSINAVRVVVGKGRDYFFMWESPVRKVVLSAKTLQPSPGSPPFTGFERGQEVLIMIGYKGSPPFDVVWAGLGEVK